MVDCKEGSYDCNLGKPTTATVLRYGLGSTWLAHHASDANVYGVAYSRLLWHPGGLSAGRGCVCTSASALKGFPFLAHKHRAFVNRNKGKPQNRLWLGFSRSFFSVFFLPTIIYFRNGIYSTVDKIIRNT